jgi:hypothetical protein
MTSSRSCSHTFAAFDIPSFDDHRHSNTFATFDIPSFDDAPARDQIFSTSPLSEAILKHDYAASVQQPTSSDATPMSFFSRIEADFSSQALPAQLTSDKSSLEPWSLDSSTMAIAFPPGLGHEEAPHTPYKTQGKTEVTSSPKYIFTPPPSSSVFSDEGHFRSLLCADAEGKHDEDWRKAGSKATESTISDCSSRSDGDVCSLPATPPIAIGAALSCRAE